MNIIIGAIAVATAAYLRIKFHNAAKKTNVWFALSVFVGLVSALTVPGDSFLVELGFSVLALIVCGFVLTLYKFEINRSFSQRRVRAKKAVAPAKISQSVSRQRLAKISGRAAFYDDRDFVCDAA